MKTARNYGITGGTKFLEPNWWHEQDDVLVLLTTRRPDTFISIPSPIKVRPIEPTFDNRYLND